MQKNLLKPQSNTHQETCFGTFTRHACCLAFWKIVFGKMGLTAALALTAAGLIPSTWAMESSGNQRDANPTAITNNDSLNRAFLENTSLDQTDSQLDGAYEECFVGTRVMRFNQTRWSERPNVRSQFHPCDQLPYLLIDVMEFFQDTHIQRSKDGTPLRMQSPFLPPVLLNAGHNPVLQLVAYWVYGVGPHTLWASPDTLDECLKVVDSPESFNTSLQTKLQPHMTQNLIEKMVSMIRKNNDHFRKKIKEKIEQIQQKVSSFGKVEEESKGTDPLPSEKKPIALMFQIVDTTYAAPSLGASALPGWSAPDDPKPSLNNRSITCAIHTPGFLTEQEIEPADDQVLRAAISWANSQGAKGGPLSANFLQLGYGNHSSGSTLIDQFYKKVPTPKLEPLNMNFATFQVSNGNTIFFTAKPLKKFIELLKQQQSAYSEIDALNNLLYMAKNKIAPFLYFLEASHHNDIKKLDISNFRKYIEAAIANNKKLEIPEPVESIKKNHLSEDEYLFELMKNLQTIQAQGRTPATAKALNHELDCLIEALRPPHNKEVAIQDTIQKLKNYYRIAQYKINQKKLELNEIQEKMDAQIEESHQYGLCIESFPIDQAEFYLKTIKKDSLRMAQMRHPEATEPEKTRIYFHWIKELCTVTKTDWNSEWTQEILESDQHAARKHRESYTIATTRLKQMIEAPLKATQAQQDIQ